MARRKPGDAIEKLIADTMAMEAEAAQEAGALGFMARALVQATLPHKKVTGPEFTRRNGAYTLTLLAPSHIGLPYGIVPRILLAWMTTEAVRTQSRELVLGEAAIAAPIRDDRNLVVGAIGIRGAMERLCADQDTVRTELVAFVRDAVLVQVAPDPQFAEDLIAGIAAGVLVGRLVSCDTQGKRALPAATAERDGDRAIGRHRGACSGDLRADRAGRRGDRPDSGL